MSTLAAVLPLASEVHHELPMPPWMFGVLALLAFAFLLGVTWSFRGTSNKYAPVAPSEDPGHEMAHWPDHPGHH